MRAIGDVIEEVLQVPSDTMIQRHAARRILRVFVPHDELDDAVTMLVREISEGESRARAIPFAVAAVNDNGAL